MTALKPETATLSAATSMAPALPPPTVEAEMIPPSSTSRLPVSIVIVPACPPPKPVSAAMPEGASCSSPTNPNGCGCTPETRT